MRRGDSWKRAAALVAAAGICQVVRGQLPTARLDGVFPAGVRAGTEVEVVLTGADLDDADRLMFSDGGLSAVRVEGMKFKVTASAGMAPGLYEVRAAGKYGISASRLFAVGAIGEVVETGDNGSVEKAMVVTVPVTVNGTTGADAADYFRFRAGKGQRLVVSCAAERIDSQLNAVVAVSDAAGRELMAAHRTVAGDARLEFEAPEEGDYTVKVHDMAWQAGVYRLTVASPEEAVEAGAMVLPLAGTVAMVPTEPLVRFEKAAAGGAEAHKVALPGTFTGSGSAEWVEFTGEKGRQVVLDVFSHRMGEPSDWFVRVLKVTKDEKGQEKVEQVAIFDDTAAPAGTEPLALGSRDPSGVLSCEEGVVYRVQMVDRFNARRPWRLVLRDPAPGFGLAAFPVSPVTRGAAVQRWSPLLRKGGTSVMQVAVLRRDGFDGAVALQMEGLPEGVSVEPVTVPAGVNSAVLVVRAGAEAKTWSGRLKVTGTSGGQTVTAGEAVPRWSVGNAAGERFGMRLANDGLVLAVHDGETAPLGIAAAEAKVYETAMGGAVEIPVKFVRDAALKGIKGEWEAMLTGMPGMRQGPVVKPAGDAQEAKLVLDVKNKDGNVFQAGEWVVYASARGTVQWQPGGEKAPVKELVDAVYSGPIRVKIADSPVVLMVPETVVVAPGGKAEVGIKLERRYGFAEAVAVELAGAKGVTAEKLSVAKEAAEGKLVIAAAADAAVGVQEVMLNAKCAWNGVEVPWSVKFKVEVKP